MVCKNTANSIILMLAITALTLFYVQKITILVEAFVLVCARSFFFLVSRCEDKILPWTHKYSCQSLANFKNTCHKYFPLNPDPFQNWLYLLQPSNYSPYLCILVYFKFIAKLEVGAMISISATCKKVRAKRTESS